MKTCGVWRVACGVWRVACGVWRVVVCGVWRVACGVWRVACGVWSCRADWCEVREGVSVVREGLKCVVTVTSAPASGNMGGEGHRLRESPKPM